MESQPCIFLGIKVKPGPIERLKIENFPLENTVDCLKTEAEKKISIPSASLELIHHGKILKDNATLQDCGVKSGEMIHVVKKKTQSVPPPPPTYTDAELQQIASSLRTLGCTPNAPGWTRAMQLLNDESAMAEILEHAPSLSEDCVTLSILHEVELLAAIGANIHTMRLATSSRPELPAALRQLTRLVHSRTNPPSAVDHAPTSGFAYSLEALSEDEDADDEDNEDGERNTITQEQLAAALQAATEVVSSSNGRDGGSVGTNQDTLPRVLQTALEPSRSFTNVADTSTPTTSGAGRPVVTPEMFGEAIAEAMNTVGIPMVQNTAASSSQSPATASTVTVPGNEDFTTQLQQMHTMGLLDDALNVRALLLCDGDVNAAIILVFSETFGD